MNEIKPAAFKSVKSSTGPRFTDTYRAARRNTFFDRPSEGNKTPAFRAALAKAKAVIAEEITNA